MNLGYARVSTTQQDLERQLVALKEAGIPAERIWADKKTGSHARREGLEAVLSHAREGDTITVVTLDRLARNMRDTLNLIHDLTEKGIGIRSLKDPIPVDTSSNELMARLSVMLLALFAEMERAWMLERVAHARSKAGRSPGRPRSVTAAQLAHARKMHASGDSIRHIAEVLKVSKSTLGRQLVSAS